MYLKEPQYGHGGGDYGIMHDFVKKVRERCSWGTHIGTESSYGFCSRKIKSGKEDYNYEGIFLKNLKITLLQLKIGVKSQ